MVGKTLSHFRILELIGEGGMGVVYRAIDIRLNRTVAIKVLRPNVVDDAERKRRFIQEARAASALNHPNIVVIYGIDSWGGTDFMAVEYVDGEGLDCRIGGRALPIAEVLHYAARIAAALGAAHAAGIVHRDIKPANIMVSREGVIKVLDFGLAKLTEPPSAESRPVEGTVRGSLLGTVAVE